jgi:phosphatidylethanolamine-binding protein (PEBP) family uncharacterized protein
MDGQAIPGEFAFAVPDEKNHVALSQNRNPQLAWSDVPEGVESFVLVVHDPDVPSKPDDVNQEGREVPADLPRIDFYHWMLLDIPSETREIAAGSQSDGVTPRGKRGPEAPGRMRHGLNSYTQWFLGRWKATTSATTDRVPRGTTLSCTTTSSRCMRWMWSSWRSTGRSQAIKWLRR